MGFPVLVTGGRGFIGSHVSKQLVDLGHAPIVYDCGKQFVWPLPKTYAANMEYRYQLLEGCVIKPGDLNETLPLRQVLDYYHPAHIIHLASLPVANVSLRRSECAFTNILGSTFSLLQALRSCTIRCLVYVSSSMAYGNFEQDPIPEDALMQPKDVYGAMKLAGEVLVRAYMRAFEIPVVIVRPSAVYGPGDNNHRVLQIWVENACQGIPITVNDPDEKLDFTYVEDIAQGLCRAVFAPPQALGEAFNITYGSARLLAEAVAILKELFPRLKVEYAEPMWSFRPKRGTLDISKAKKLLGYQPQYPLEEGLGRYADYVSRLF